MVRVKLYFLCMLLFVAFISCSSDSSKNTKISGDYVSIEDKSDYYVLSIDYTASEATPEKIGEEYITLAKKIIPNLESLFDSYLESVITNAINEEDETTKESIWTLLNTNRQNLWITMESSYPNYKRELEAMGSAFSGGDSDELGDGKLSKNEFYLLSLLPDVGRSTSCSGITVFNNGSNNQETITGRSLEWSAGTNGELLELHAVTQLKVSPSKTVTLIGFIGQMGVISAYNNDGVFAAILDSPVPVGLEGSLPIDPYGDNHTDNYKYCPRTISAPIPPWGDIDTDKDGTNDGTISIAHPYTYALRYALETSTTRSGIADYMTSSDRRYTWNHNLLLADKDGGSVVENFQGAWIYTNDEDPSVRYEVIPASRITREASTTLLEGVTWDYTDYAIAVVNSNIASGQPDNHTKAYANTDRWGRYQTLVGAKNHFTMDEIGEILSDETKGSENTSSIFKPLSKDRHSGTLQQIVFKPVTGELKIKFINANDVPKFTTVSLPQ